MTVIATIANDLDVFEPCGIFSELWNAAQTTDGEPQGTYTLPVPDEDHLAYTVEITADERPQQRYESYCLECDWTVNTTEYSHAEVSRRMVDHATETDPNGDRGH